jgi:hypothetical protein
MAGANDGRARHHYACREAREAATPRNPQAAERLKAAALKLGFAKNKVGVWSTVCPYCGYTVQLHTTQNGHVRASGVNPNCTLVPEIHTQLRKWGSQ